MKKHPLVDDYINSFSGETKNRLIRMRQIIHELAPEAVEDFAYKIAAYKSHGKPLVYFAGYDNHIGFYATPNGHVEFAEAFSKYKQGKGSVQFPHDEPLPEELIRAVIAYRLEQTSSGKA